MARIAAVQHQHGGFGGMEHDGWCRAPVDAARVRRAGLAGGVDGPGVCASRLVKSSPKSQAPTHSQLPKRQIPARWRLAVGSVLEVGAWSLGFDALRSYLITSDGTIGLPSHSQVPFGPRVSARDLLPGTAVRSSFGSHADNS